MNNVTSTTARRAVVLVRKLTKSTSFSTLNAFNDQPQESSSVSNVLSENCCKVTAAAAAVDKSTADDECSLGSLLSHHQGKNGPSSDMDTSTSSAGSFVSSSSSSFSSSFSSTNASHLHDGRNVHCYNDKSFVTSDPIKMNNDTKRASLTNTINDDKTIDANVTNVKQVMAIINDAAAAAASNTMNHERQCMNTDIHLARKMNSLNTNGNTSIDQIVKNLLSSGQVAPSTSFTPSVTRTTCTAVNASPASKETSNRKSTQAQTVTLNRAESAELNAVSSVTPNVTSTSLDNCISLVNSNISSSTCNSSFLRSIQSPEVTYLHSSQFKSTSSNDMRQHDAKHEQINSNTVAASSGICKSINDLITSSTIQYVYPHFYYVIINSNNITSEEQLLEAEKIYQLKIDLNECIGQAFMSSLKLLGLTVMEKDKLSVHCDEIETISRLLLCLSSRLKIVECELEKSVTQNDSADGKINDSDSDGNNDPSSTNTAASATCSTTKSMTNANSSSATVLRLPSKVSSEMKLLLMKRSKLLSQLKEALALKEHIDSRSLQLALNIIAKYKLSSQAYIEYLKMKSTLIVEQNELKIIRDKLKLTLEQHDSGDVTKDTSSSSSKTDEMSPPMKQPC